MIFGDVPVAAAEGAILVHSLKLGTAVLRKGRVLAAADLAAIEAAGIARLTIVRLDPGDLGENEAAARIAAAVAGPGIAVGAPFTGRANLTATARGLLVFDRDRVDRLNLVDEATTLGTLPPYSVVEPGQMVATVKIIPFAAPARAVAGCVAIAEDGARLLHVAAFRPHAVALVQTRLAGIKDSVLDKTASVTAARLDALGSHLAGETRCDHDSAALAPCIAAALDAGAAIVLVAGASAIVDRRDVIPAAVVAAGGAIEHFGMPVDPGNLLLLGRVQGRPVLGLPGCARSPKENGFDWVLQRLAAGLPVGAAEIMRMGSGGLLAETPLRGQPRAAAPAEAAKANAAPRPSGTRPSTSHAPGGPRIAALLLAAGRSSRMGGPNKMLAEIDGTPMVARVARRLLSSRARPIIAVLGNQADTVDAALGRLPIERVRNPDFAAGLSTSLKAGIAALPEDADGVLVCLGDMPNITGRDLDRLIAAFNPLEGRAIVVPMRGGRRGNPVLWARRFFPEMLALAGDTGARHLIAEHAELIAEIEMDSDGVLVDIDTPEALAALRAGGPTRAATPEKAPADG